jgi:hypothetical protein
MAWGTFLPMGRVAQALAVATGTCAGLFVGLVGSRALTGKMPQKSRTDVVLVSTVVGAAAGAGITSYATTPKLLSA